MGLREKLLGLVRGHTQPVSDLSETHHPRRDYINPVTVELRGTLMDHGREHRRIRLVGFDNYWGKVGRRLIKTDSATEEDPSWMGPERQILLDSLPRIVAPAGVIESHRRAQQERHGKQFTNKS